MYFLFFDCSLQMANAALDADNSAASALLQNSPVPYRRPFLCVSLRFSPIFHQYFVGGIHFQPFKNDKGQAPQHPPLTYFARILPLLNRLVEVTPSWQPNPRAVHRPNVRHLTTLCCLAVPTLIVTALGTAPPVIARQRHLPRAH